MQANKMKSFQALYFFQSYWIFSDFFSSLQAQLSDRMQSFPPTFHHASSNFPINKIKTDDSVSHCKKWKKIHYFNHGSPERRFIALHDADTNAISISWQFESSLSIQTCDLNQKKI